MTWVVILRTVVLRKLDLRPFHVIASSRFSALDHCRSMYLEDFNLHMFLYIEDLTLVLVFC